MHEIEKGIPIPPPSGVGKLKYPWNEMEAGDSIGFDSTESFQKARVAAASWTQRHPEYGMRSIARSYESGGGRIWFERLQRGD